MIYDWLLKIDSKYIYSEEECLDTFKTASITTGFLNGIFCLGLSWLLRCLGVTAWLIEHEWARYFIFFLLGYATLEVAKEIKKETTGQKEKDKMLFFMYIPIVMVFTMLNDEVWEFFVVLGGCSILISSFIDENATDGLLFTIVKFIITCFFAIIYIIIAYRRGGFTVETGFDWVLGALLMFKVPYTFRNIVFLCSCLVKDIKLNLLMKEFGLMPDKKYSIKKIRNSPLASGYYLGRNCFLYQFFSLGETMTDVV